jgi:uncharacterized protein YkwD
MTVRRWIAAWLLAATITVATVAPAAASSPDGTDTSGTSDAVLAPELGPASVSTTSGPIETTDKKAVRSAYLRWLVPAQRVQPGWTGSTATCARGTESAASKRATIGAVNYFRAMAGLPPVAGGNAGLDDQALAAALMMDAQNALSHNPPSTWRCYTAAGYSGAQSSNLAIGSTGARAIHGYMDDFGSSNGQVGHRRWILFPAQVAMGTGSTTRANALHVVGSHGPRPPGVGWVAWPNAGYVPWSVVPTNPSKPKSTLFRWSLSSNAHPNADYSGARVTMTMNGEPLRVSQEPFQANSYRDNTLVWTARRASGKFPRGRSPVIDVHVTGIRVGSTTLSHAYTVRPFPLGPPLAPEVADPTSTGGAVTVSWSPAKKQGTPVTGYRVKLLRLHSGTTSQVTTTTVGRDQLSATFDGLLRGEVYYGVVEAKSKAGWGPEGRPNFAVRVG